jgi:predicted nucleotidyltransferase
MISMQRIQDYATRIAQQYSPERIILFGSYAYGTPDEDSDVDLLVVMPFEGRERSQAIAIKRATGVDCAMDLLVYDPARLKQRLDWGDSFLQEIVQKGRTLYESSHAGVGR